MGAARRGPRLSERGLPRSPGQHRKQLRRLAANAHGRRVRLQVRPRLHLQLHRRSRRSTGRATPTSVSGHLGMYDCRPLATSEHLSAHRSDRGRTLPAKPTLYLLPGRSMHGRRHHQRRSVLHGRTLGARPTMSWAQGILRDRRANALVAVATLLAAACGTGNDSALSDGSDAASGDSADPHQGQNLCFGCGGGSYWSTGPCPTLGCSGLPPYDSGVASAESGPSDASPSNDAEVAVSGACNDDSDCAFRKNVGCCGLCMAKAATTPSGTTCNIGVGQCPPFEAGCVCINRRCSTGSLLPTQTCEASHDLCGLGLKCCPSCGGGAATDASDACGTWACSSAYGSPSGPNTCSLPQ